MGPGSHVSFSQTQRQCLALEGGKAVDLHSPKTTQRYSYLVSQVGVGVSLPGARPLLTEDMAGLGRPVFRQLPKNVDGSVDSRSHHVPRARTKENMECFLDDTVSIQVMHSCGRAVRRGLGCLQGWVLCCGTHSCLQTCVPGLCLLQLRESVLDAPSGDCAMGMQFCYCQHRQSADTNFVYVADALVLVSFPGHSAGASPHSPWTTSMTLPTCVLSIEEAAGATPALAHTDISPVSVS